MRVMRDSHATMAEGAPANDGSARTAAPIAELRPQDSARQAGLSLGQWLALAILIAGLVFAFRHAPTKAGLILLLTVQFGFLATAVWRAILVLTPIERPRANAAASLPRYTILAALHREAAVAPQLIKRLAIIDYPADRLESFLLLEAHDAETIAAAMATPRPDWLQVLIVPPGAPQTKPRALNWGLLHASGDLVTVYDAEDDPDPLQLREAAARFAADTSGALACLQAPLRIRSRWRDRPTAPFLDRQFAAEYAALFELIVPAMARLGLPFPLGGTSNHFRADVLRAVGGWDAWNVTEDADLGFRLWRRGWRLGAITRPTYESPPERLEVWLPQRTRWLKGYMQTLLVHLRRPLALGPRGLFALFATLVMTLIAAATHAPSLAWVIAGVAVSVRGGVTPDMPIHALGILLLGAASAWLTCFVGARRAGVRYGVAEMLSAPAYWSLTSLALIHALWRLIAEPHKWDKTPHQPDEPPLDTGRDFD